MSDTTTATITTPASTTTDAIIDNNDNITVATDNTCMKEEVYRKRKKYFSKSNSISYENTNPLMIVKGYKCTLVDDCNIEYLDTRNNVAHCGHCHPIIVQAIQQQVSLINTNTRYLHPIICNLAEELLNLLQLYPTLTKVFFVNSGSEANDLALRLARANSNGCTNTIVVDHAYHGHTIGTLEVSPYKYEHIPIKEYTLYEQTQSTSYKFSSPGHHIWKVPCPDIYRGIYRNDTYTAQEAATLYASHVLEACNYYSSKLNNDNEYNDNNNNTDSLSSSCKQSATVRAIILEGGMSVGGVIIPPSNYIQQVVTAVRKCGGLYIADEVQTGFGRLGTSMWAFEQQQYQYQHQQTQTQQDDDTNNNNTNDNMIVVPDIITIGKPFGNGMSIGAVITTTDVVTKFEECSVEYFNTFGGNPVCAIAALTMIHVLQKEQLQQNATIVGTFLKEQLVVLQNELITTFHNINDNSNNDCTTDGADTDNGGTITTTTTSNENNNKYCYIGDVRGSGLFIGIDFVTNIQTRTAATIETSIICTILKEKYFILTSIDGPYNNIIVVKPPMVFTINNATYLIQSLRTVLLNDLLVYKSNNNKYDESLTSENATHTPT